MPSSDKTETYPTNPYTVMPSMAKGLPFPPLSQNSYLDQYERFQQTLKLQQKLSVNHVSCINCLFTF
jgi:hypothetical protein